MSKNIIAVIEDDLILSKIIQESLEEEGYDVIMAYNGDDGIKIIRQYRPAVILLDILMPRKNGFEVLEILKHDLELSKIPVIVLTMLNADDNLQKSLELGAIDYIVKSQYAIEEVVEKVNNIVAKNIFRV